MKRLLNTVYISNPEYYLSLEGENIVIQEKSTEVARFPLHNIQNIVSLGYRGISPALMKKCMDMKISISFHSMNGKYLAGVVGVNPGNVLLRKGQYRLSEDSTRALSIDQNIIAAKITNSRWILERATRDYELRVDVSRLKNKSIFMKEAAQKVFTTHTASELRGVEGEASAVYYSVFNELILQQKEEFIFSGRNRRPPLDKVNAMLSFAYSLLAAEYTSALSSVGLDPYVGFFHTDRPGRCSLALDLMEELRAVFCDRLVLTLINKKIITGSNFVEKEDGAVIMEDEARKTFLSAWQTKKQEVLEHPFLKEKVEWGIVPYVQALLLSRFIRGDLDGYPSFFWK